MNMGFGLDLNVRPQMELECTLCKRSMLDHAPSCLQKRCADLEQERTMRLLRCPKCHKMALLPNRDDYLECTECQSLFTRSQVAAGYDPDVLERTFILSDREPRPIQVLVIPEKGKGYIPIDLRLDELCKARDKAREKVLKEQEEEQMDPKEEAEKKLSELIMQESCKNPLSDDEARRLLRTCFAHFITDAEELETLVERLIEKRREVEEQRDPDDAHAKARAIRCIKHSIALLIYYDRKEDEELSREKFADIIKRDVITLDEMVETFRSELEKSVKAIKEK